MVSLSIPGGLHEGVEKINSIVMFYSQSLKAVCSRSGGQSIHGVVRLPWSYGPPDASQRLTATDVGVTKDAKLYVFIDPSSRKVSSFARVQKTTNLR